MFFITFCGMNNNAKGDILNHIINYLFQSENE